MKTVTAWTLNFIYLLIYTLMTPVILYKRVFRGRSLGNFGERALGLAPRVHSDHHCVWLHAVSVGEVNLLETLLQQLKRRYPDSKYVISTTTATGMRLASKKFPDYRCFYFPIDFSWAIRNALRRISPDVVVLTELEVWPNLINIAHDRGIPVVVVNGRLSRKSYQGYVKRKRFVRPVFRKLHRVIAQTNEYGRRFVQLGCPPERVHVSGSIKFDGAMTPPDSSMVEQLRHLIQLKEDDVLWVAGSTQDPEELMVAPIWSRLAGQHPDLRLVVVPRHPHRGQKILEDLKQSGLTGRLRSRNENEPVSRNEVLIVDTIGELKAWWSLADVAFVGGSFGERGGQNMLEPAACGAAVCFGPNTWNFRQIVELMVSQDVATEVECEADLEQFVAACVADRELAATRGQRALQFVESSQGAVEKTCQIMQEYFASSVLLPAKQHSKAA